MKTRDVGLVVTLLTSMLSSLAIEEKTGGFCSCDTTPGEFWELNFPGTSDISSVLEFTRRRVSSSMREAELEQEDSSEYAEAPRSAVLYLCGQQSMSLFLLLEECQGHRLLDYYLYRLDTPWKHKITAPQAAATFLGSWCGSVACSW